MALEGITDKRRINDDAPEVREEPPLVPPWVADLPDEVRGRCAFGPLVRFEAHRVRFLKIGRSIATQERLPRWLRYGARVVQVIESRYVKVQPAEQHIIGACSDYRMPTHPFTEHFSTRETFRMDALSVIATPRPHR